jgi:glutathione peroxidase-family protein
MTIDIDQNLVAEAMKQQPGEIEFPISIYDIKIASADGTNPDILGSQKGKVTLLFNVAAGCGNIPQHGVIEQLNQIYKNEPDFSIIAVTVDDFVCHGYPEFQDGLDKYIEKNNLDLTPGQVAKKYAEEHFHTTFEFTELTNGRHDKHTYDPNYAPGSVKIQDQHELWSYLTHAFDADMQESGVPFHDEEVPWSEAKPANFTGKRCFSPITGNFTKFLIDRTGTKARRYANGFLLGERTIGGDTFPWFPEKYQSDGRKDHNPLTGHHPELPPEMVGNFPTVLQSFGIDVSLKMISRDINEYIRKS